MLRLQKFRSSNETFDPLNQPDEVFLKRLQFFQRVSLILGGLIAVVILCAWIFPVVGIALPPSWVLMKANTALCLMISTISLYLFQKQDHGFTVILGRLGGIILIVIAGSALLGHLLNHSFWLDTVLAPDAGSEMPGRMSMQTSVFFLMTGVTFLNELKDDRIHLVVLDLLFVGVTLLTLIIFSGYCFNALIFFGQSYQIRTSPHTLIGMLLLIAAMLPQRVRSGFFVVLAGTGVGSKFIRLALPLGIFLVFSVIGVGSYLALTDLLSIRYAAALTVSVTSAVLAYLVLWMARMINSLEYELRQMSLVDELTQIQNRRGFFLLGDHTFNEGKRYGVPVTVLFFDLDGLKVVNDTLGHDAGSDLIFKFSRLLQSTFRKSDIVARLGGDEFAVVTRDDEFKSALERLSLATVEVNTSRINPYNIDYSVGVATYLGAESGESFSDVVDRADKAMYEQKRVRKNTSNHKVSQDSSGV